MPIVVKNLTPRATRISVTVHHGDLSDGSE